MKLDQRNAYSDVVPCSSDLPGWLLRHRERDILRQYLLTAELVKQCLGVNGSRIDVALSKIASKHINVPQPAAIRAYLLDHLDMLDIVVKACDTASVRFSEAQLILMVYRDPEIDDKYLMLCIRKDEYSDDFLDALHAVYTCHALELSNKSGWFQVTTDFAPPAR